MDFLIEAVAYCMLALASTFIYCLIVNLVMYDFLQKAKKIITSDWQAFFLGFVVILVSTFKLFLPLVYSSEIITIFVFLPSLAFYNSSKKKIIIKSSIKILFLILFIKICLTSTPKFNNTLVSVYTFFKSLIYASFYCECLKNFAILAEYFQEDLK